jgi:ssDNA-binding Zn-finger/Zn-ribbon topoisomerase 1
MPIGETCMSMETDYKFENFQEYYGDVKQVKRIINECQICGAKLVLTHLSDYKNLLMQESARCPECGQGNRKIIHVIN